MKSSIYISSEKIELIAYEGSAKRLSIQEYFTVPLPEGTMINGKITEPTQLEDCLRSIKEKNPQLLQTPSLVVDGNFLLSKKLNVPVLKRPQYIHLIEEEFADAVDNPQDLICDYHPLNTTSADQNTILACATEKETIESYIAVFQAAGIKLASIRLGLQALLHCVEQNTAQSSKTYVLNVIDGVSMLSLVFDKGVNVFMSRTRLYYEGTEALARVLAENLSGLMQFNRSQQLDDIETSYYMGLSRDDIAFLKESNPHYGVEIATFDATETIAGTEKLAEETHFPFLSLLLPEKSIDFLLNYQNVDKVRRAAKPIDKRIWMAGGLLAVIAAPILFFTINNALMDHQSQSIHNYINDPTVLAKSKELDAISSKTAYIEKVRQQIALWELQMSALSPITGELLDYITQTKSDTVRINLIDFDEETGKITVNGSCANETVSASYVESLKQFDVILDITYTGYSMDDAQEMPYSFSIELALLEEKEEES